MTEFSQLLSLVFSSLMLSLIVLTAAWNMGYLMRKGIIMFKQLANQSNDS